ncbi:galactose mutarotase-like domain-containing protein [Aspergillus pseudodeflectus]|uniref:Galactose mutarotase-like domain-containing protein n=1 Tax=Aspergillus pseudodeflectus TaxID=176178 RepID=A0ABR4JTB2_9EURO
MKRSHDVGDLIHLGHCSGSSATISRLGVTVLSLQTPRAGEMLWLSPDGSHGGIPIIFPTFGNVDDGRIMRVGDQRDMLRHMKSVPHHGFAKDCVWDLVTTHEPRDHSNLPDIEDTGANSCRGSCPSQALLRLSPLNVPVDLGGSWLRESGDWEILYRIALRNDGLILDLCIENNNTVGDAFRGLRAKILLHNYFRVSSPGNISIHGLHGSHSLPQPGTISSLYSHDALRFKVGEFVDQVWRLKPDDAMNVIVEDENKITAGIRIMTSNLPDLVLWAPETHAPVEPGVRFICVERGSVVEPFTVPTGGGVFLRQVLTDR